MAQPPARKVEDLFRFESLFPNFVSRGTTLAETVSFRSCRIGDHNETRREDEVWGGRDKIVVWQFGLFGGILSTLETWGRCSTINYIYLLDVLFHCFSTMLNSNHFVIKCFRFFILVLRLLINFMCFKCNYSNKIYDNACVICIKNIQNSKQHLLNTFNKLYEYWMNKMEFKYEFNSNKTNIFGGIVLFGNDFNLHLVQMGARKTLD